MPKPTFENLSAEKRERLIDAAVEEFASRPYPLASLSRVAEAADVAKGSLYQYFDHKLDLYRWLVGEELPRRKLAWFAARGVPLLEGGLLDRLADQLEAGLDFGRGAPALARLGDRVMLPSGDDEVDAFHATLRAGARDMTRAAVAQAIARGELRADLDPDHGAALLGPGLRALMDEALIVELGVGTTSFMTDPAQVGRIPPKRLRRLIEGVVEALRLGMAGVAP